MITRSFILILTDRNLVSVGSDLIFVADNVAKGIDTRNPSYITIASTRLQTMLPKVAKVTADINALSLKYGL
jgi:hypothetical protein